MSFEEKQLRVTQLKDEITRVVGLISELEAEKKTTTKSFNETIKEKKSELEVHLNELKELQAFSS